MFKNYPDVMDVADIQKALNIGRNMVYRLLESKQIKSIRIGRKIKIPKPYLIEYVIGTH